MADLIPQGTPLNAGREAINKKIADMDKRVDRIISQSGDSNTEIFDARLPAEGEAYPTLKSRLDSENKKVKEYADGLISTVGNASPKPYATVAELQASFPNGASGVYVVSADGKWYYWNGTAWTAGGQFQSTGLADYSIQSTKLFGANVVNVFNPDTSTDGKRIDAAANFPAGGTVEIVDSAFCISDFIPVKNGDVFTIRSVATANSVVAIIYDSSKTAKAKVTVTTSWQAPFTFTVNTASAAFMKVNLIINTVPKTQQMVAIGSSYPGVYSPYNAATIDWLLLKNKTIGSVHLTDELAGKINPTIPKLYFPKTVYGVTGKPLRLYYKGVLSAKAFNNFVYKSTFADGIFKIRQDHLNQGTFTNDAGAADTLYVYDAKTGQLIDSMQYTYRITKPASKSNPSSVKNVLMLGDSLTDAGYISREVKTALVDMYGFSNFNFIGKMTDFGVRNEGRGGYTWDDYLYDPSQGRPEFNYNPFWDATNAKLDFHKYMADSGFSGEIDYLIIELGLNNKSALGQSDQTIVARAKAFIDAVHSEYPNCKVYLCGLAYTSEYQDAVDAYLYNVGLFSLSKAYEDFCLDASYSSFVKFIPIAATFNAEYGYPFQMQAAYRLSTEQIKVVTDHVHPNETGYCMFADAIVAAFLYHM